MPHQYDKWSACLASLVVPGVGQLLVGRWMGGLWLGAFGALIGARSFCDSLPAEIVLGLCQFILACASALDAKRGLEPLATIEASCSAVGPIQLRVRRRSLDCRFELVLNSTAQDVWPRITRPVALRELDPLHHDFRFLDDPDKAARPRFVIEHRFMGISLDRLGQVLVRRVGQRFAFSDLSRFGTTCGFPHVIFFDFEELAPEVTPVIGNGGRSRLTVACRGKWTSRWLPLCVAEYWIRAVAWEHRRLLLTQFPVTKGTRT